MSEQAGVHVVSKRIWNWILMLSSFLIAWLRRQPFCAGCHPLFLLTWRDWSCSDDMSPASRRRYCRCCGATTVHTRGTWPRQWPRGVLRHQWLSCGWGAWNESERFRFRFLWRSISKSVFSQVSCHRLVFLPVTTFAVKEMCQNKNLFIR